MGAGTGLGMELCMLKKCGRRSYFKKLVEVRFLLSHTKILRDGVTDVLGVAEEKAVTLKTQQ